jgi:hypothetical protein
MHYLNNTPLPVRSIYNALLKQLSTTSQGYNALLKQLSTTSQRHNALLKQLIFFQKATWSTNVISA